MRPGPAILDADSWEQDEAADPAVGPYEGRRRAGGPSIRMWVVLAAVLVGLGAVIAVPLALVAGRDQSGPAAADPTSTAQAPTADPTSPGLGLVPATGAAPIAPSSTTRTTAAGFSLAMEAEGPGVDLSGSARVDTYAGASGGRIVRNVGKWEGRSGSVKFTVTLPSAGSYVITIWYVHMDGEQTRSAQITVSGADPVTRSFAGSSTCCASLALAPIALGAGSHTVTIGNPTARAPSIDKIAIART
jgi:hypothetical protein